MGSEKRTFDFLKVRELNHVGDIYNYLQLGEYGGPVVSVSDLRLRDWVPS